MSGTALGITLQQIAIFTGHSRMAVLIGAYLVNFSQPQPPSRPTFLENWGNFG